MTPTVTVVDDDEYVRESLADLMHSIDLEVDCYASGTDFLNRWDQERPGCVVLDLRMPQMSGLDVLGELAARNAQVPVIVISGHGDIPAAVTAMKSGAIDFFEKPYRAAALVECVRKAIELDSRNRQTAAERDQLAGRYRTLNNVEIDVLRLTADGRPDKSIALKLDLSLRTIQLRRASLMQKLGAHSRAELIRIAQTLEQLAIVER